MVTLLALGTCTIQATQAGNTNWAAATSVSNSFLVTQVLGTSAILVSSAAGTSSVVLTYSGAWTATANASFLHLASGSTSGTGSALVVFTYDAFPGTGARTGTLTVAGRTLTVTQAGSNYLAPGPVTTLLSSGLSEPEGVAVDGSGNVYIADRMNGAVKEWNAATQQVSTLVGTGLSYPDAVAVDGSGNVYIADTGDNALKEWSAATGQVATLVSTGLSGPGGVAVDSFGDVYLADTGNNAIRKWNTAAGQLTTLVSSGLSGPTGLAVDGCNVYIADTGHNAIKEWSAATGQVTALVSSGLSGPSGLAVDGSGNLYLADTGNHALKEWSAATGQVAVLVSTGTGEPGGAAVDSAGNVYLADYLGNTVEEMPWAFTGPADLTEPAPAGQDTLLTVLPSTAPLAGIFAPASDQSWLSIGTIASGAIHFSFTANASGGARTAHITVLGQQVTVTQVSSSAVLSIAKTHSTTPMQGQTGMTYTVVVSNGAFAQATNGEVTVTETIPAGLTLVSMSGTNWDCTALPNCTRSDALASGSSYPAITVTVNVESDTALQVTNQVSVTGGGSAGASASDVTAILPFTCNITGDGTVSAADIQAITKEALGLAPAVHDLNQDGVVNILDVQIVVNAARGLGCAAK
jgi:uncharacterized repeat protein (TIGR01451 family)